MNKYNVGDLIVQDDEVIYTITKVLKFIDNSFGYDTEYYDRDNNRVTECYMSQVHIDTLLKGKQYIKAKYYPVNEI